MLSENVTVVGELTGRQNHSESHQWIVVTGDMKTLSRLRGQTRGPSSVFIPPQSLGLVCQLNTCQFSLDYALKANFRLYLVLSFKFNLIYYGLWSMNLQNSTLVIS